MLHHCTQTTGQRTPRSKPSTCAQLIETLGVGGAENLAVRIANGMAEIGHPSHLIVLKQAGPLAQFVSTNVKLHELGIARESIATPSRFLISLTTGLRRLEAIIRSQQIDVVQSHLPGANFWGLLLTLRRRVAVLATIHNNQEFNYGNTDNPFRARLRRSAYGAIVRRGARTIAVSPAVKESLVRDLGLGGHAAAKIAVVLNGVKVPDQPGYCDRAACRDQFGAPRGAFVFVAAGRHAEQKNFGDLVRAAFLLDQCAGNWFLVIAGDGPERQALMQQARAAGLEEKIGFPGNVMAMNDLWGAADAFVMSSLWEGLPLVLLEAMAAGLPVVATRIPGVVDVITDSTAGVLVAPGNPDELACAMASMIADPEQARALGRAARGVVEHRFDFAETIRELHHLYETCAECRSSRSWDPRS